MKRRSFSKSDEHGVFRKLADARPDAAVTSQALAETARESMQTLALRSSAGDEDAMLQYLRVIMTAVDEWGVITLTHMEKARQIARKTSNWPVALSYHPETNDYIKRKIAKLELGADLPIRLPDKRRPWSATTGANMHVLLGLNGLQHVREIGFSRGPLNDEFPKDILPRWHAWERHAIALPPLSESTAADWFEVLWESFLAHHAGHPEYNKALCRLGRHREKASVRKGQQKKETPRTADANIRDGIRESLRQAFRRIVKTSPTTNATT